MRKLIISGALTALVVVLAACNSSSTVEEPADAASEANSDDDLGPPPPPDGAEAATTDAVDATPGPSGGAVIEGVTEKRIAFDQGSSSARLTGSITGDETIDYLLNVKSGQALNISMATQNTATYFNLIEPGETEVAIFNGSVGGNMYEGVARKNGDYRIRVYMMRSAARRGEKADFDLEAAVN